jgi:two-component system sensor histidine kinase HupT/HoxJ
MIGKINISVVLLLMSTVIIIVMAYMIYKNKNKSQLKNVFISIIALLFIWNIGTVLELYIRLTYGYTEMVFINICYFSITFLPVSVLLFGIVYAHTQIRLSWKYLLLFIIPMISTLLIWTNNIHKLFFIQYSVNSKDAIYGSYFYFHSIYSYICILVGISYLIAFSIKNSGFFSKQSIFIIIGFLVPIFVNITFTLNLLDLPFLANSIAFTIFGLFTMIAIFKFDFLNISPIAMRTIVDRISDGFIVIDKNFRITDYNKTLQNTFDPIVKINRKHYLFDILKFLKYPEMGSFKEVIRKVNVIKEPIVFEHHFCEGNFDKYFNIEITPIISGENHLGTIILLKDITQNKANLKKISDQQDQIIEKERLASLGMLMGGISHNLKTPIMSISGCIIALEDLTKEYHESVGNSIVSESDHHEIAGEMLTNINDIKAHFSYMSNALTAIKNQVAVSDARIETSFTLEEIIQNIEFLMKYEVKSNFCNLIISNETKENFLINGDIGTLVQIIDNLISNSIQSYGKITHTTSTDVSSRDIEFIVYEIGDYIVFKVKDYGKGVTQAIKDKLFKEMVTTKGKEGSGIGLYLSYSKVKGMFKGDMWLESEDERGASFYIKVHKNLI